MSDVTVWKVADHEGNGECQACGKTGLRWVVYLSDGSRVGGECAKRIVGWAPTKTKFSWLEGMCAVCEGPASPTQYVVLWQSRQGALGAVSVNGVVHATGPIGFARKEYERWVA